MSYKNTQTTTFLKTMELADEAAHKVIYLDKGSEWEINHFIIQVQKTQPSTPEQAEMQKETLSYLRNAHALIEHTI